MKFKTSHEVIQAFGDIAKQYGTDLTGCVAYVTTTINKGRIVNQGTLKCPDGTELKCEVQLDCTTGKIMEITTASCSAHLDNEEGTDKDLQAKSKTLISVMTLLFGLPFSYTLQL